MSLLEANELTLIKKILSVREHYDFVDKSGSKLGEADGNIMQVPPRFVVKDTHGNELMRLEGKIFSLHNEFTIRTPDGEELATIKRKIAKFIGEEFWLEKNGKEFMRIKGNFTEHDYQMLVNDAPVASVHRKWVTVRDQLGVSIMGDIDQRVILGSVIVIEHVEVTERQRSSS